MTALTDPFDHIQKKPLKNKAGEIVAYLDYVGWSQVADRLDDAAPGWSFAIVNVGADGDWAWGRLSLPDGRTFENIGYAENADADWKKEALKDAVSDALKRCAALAGVARYLYDKTGTAPQTASQPRREPQRESVTTAATRPVLVHSGAPAPELDDDGWAGLIDAPAAPKNGNVSDNPQCPAGHGEMVYRPAGVSKRTNKPYKAFWGCSDRECKETARA